MKARYIVLLTGLLLVLAGCGQKGPLYLPGHAPESQTEGPFGSDISEGPDPAQPDAQQRQSSRPAGRHDSNSKDDASDGNAR